MTTNEQAIIAATLSQHVYGDISDGLDGSIPSQVDIGGSTYTVQKASGLHSNSPEYFGALYKNETTNEYVLVHRGADTLADWTGTNAQILFNKSVDQVDDAFQGKEYL